MIPSDAAIISSKLLTPWWFSILEMINIFFPLSPKNRKGTTLT
jgi:hypothetical protein